MATKLVAILLALLAMSTPAYACKIVIQHQVMFATGSSELSGTEVARLASWLDKMRGWYRYDEADVEGTANGSVAGGKALARERADIAAHALHSLYDGLKIYVTSNVYAPGSMGSAGTESATVQLFPLNPPDCNPVPIPGFVPPQ